MEKVNCRTKKNEIKHVRKSCIKLSARSRSDYKHPHGCVDHDYDLATRKDICSRIDANDSDRPNFAVASVIYKGRKSSSYLVTRTDSAEFVLALRE